MKGRGQGTTEYLIILAVIIVVALVVVGVMGWFPGLGTGITEQQSRAYWQSASPLAMKDWKITTTATDAEFTLQNMTIDSISVTDMSVGGTSIDIDPDVDIAAGSTANITGTTGIACPTIGRAYQYDVTITYDVSGGISGKTQMGQKPLIGTCT